LCGAISPPPRILGVDDWAWRRGQRYGTIICDLERHRVIDCRTAPARHWPPGCGSTAKAHLLLRTWCRSCRHSIDVDPGEQATRYGADLPVPEWAARLVCSQCSSRAVDFVVAPRHTGGLGDD
jgi:hypothetical protein